MKDDASLRSEIHAIEYEQPCAERCSGSRAELHPRADATLAAGSQRLAQIATCLCCTPLILLLARIHARWRASSEVIAASSRAQDASRLEWIQAERGTSRAEIEPWSFQPSWRIHDAGRRTINGS
jgi:hypothetical protein